MPGPTGEGLVARVGRAHALLAWSGGAACAVAVGAAGVLVAGGGGAGLVLAAALGGLLLGRARVPVVLAHKVPALAGGAVALALPVVVGVARSGSWLAGLLAVAVLLVAAAVLLAVPAAGPVAGPAAGPAGERPEAPRWARLADLVELVLALSLVGLAAWTAGLFRWFGLG